jgi:hypothetical protein
VISRKLDDELIQNLRLSTGVETNACGIVHHLRERERERES